MASLETIEDGQTPSLIRQIVDEDDLMSEEEKVTMLGKIKMQQAVAEIEEFEASFTPSLMTE